MDFVPGASLFAGVVTTFAVTSFMYSLRSFMRVQMPTNLLLALGSSITQRKRFAYVIGTTLHIAIGLFFAAAHTAFYALVNLESDLAFWGLLAGFVQWLMASIAIGLFAGKTFPVRSGGIAEPGYFAIQSPEAERVGFLVAHVMFGMVVGGFYEALVF